ncbi:MAG: ATP-binding protein [Fulvivirga sp.]|nr:ATP-binding protein [Fulvivirga sp.]
MEKHQKTHLEQKFKRLKQKLSDEQSKNSLTTAILEGGKLIIWAVDDDKKLISFNQNFFNHFLDESPDKNLAFFEGEELVIKNEKTFWSERYEIALQGESLNLEVRIERNKQDFWHEVFLNPVYDPAGEIIGVSGLAYDITEKMDSKLSLIESEQMFRNIFESFQDLYFRCSIPGDILMLSPSVQDITGYSEKDLLGKNITNYYLYTSKTKSLIKDLIRQKRVRNFEANLIDKKGTIIPCICNVRLIYNTRGKPAYIEGVARDIKELKETNKKLVEAKELAEESLKIKERFLANMSHEIRTPLNGIIGMIHLLDQEELTKTQEKQVHSLKSSADILLNLLNDLLDLAKIEAGKMKLKYQPVNTNDLLENICNLYIQQARVNNIQLSCKKEDTVPPYVFSDETKLIQIFSNLVSNAIKFTPKGGTIEVILTLKEKRKTGWIKLEGIVKDTGIGISDEEKKYLFRSFTQGDSSMKKAYKGTGLGLYITKELVNLFNGEIEVESAPNRGSTFRFTAETSTTRIRPEVKDTPLKKISGSPQVLIVDDNAINLDLAKGILEGAGCETTLCNNGLTSLKLVKRNKYDVILMDIQMPDIDGVMAAKSIRTNLLTEAPPIIAMTAYSMEGDKEKFLNQGFTDYIAKPIKPELLIDKLEKWIKLERAPKNNHQPAEDLKGLRNINVAILDTLKSFGGEETVQIALNEFDAECNQQITTSENAFANEDIKEVLVQLHTLKGNAGTLGVEKIAAQAEKMEDDLKKKKYSNFEEELSKLKKLYNSFKQELKALK